MEIMKTLRVRFYLIMVLLIGLFLFNNLAAKLSLYWIYRWLDVPMHFIGGALVCWIWLIGVSIYKKTLQIDWWQAFWGTLIIGVVWEIVEFYMKVSQVVPYYAMDTIKDILMDVIGGLVSYTLWDLISKYKNINTNINAN